MSSQQQKQRPPEVISSLEGFGPLPDSTMAEAVQKQRKKGLRERIVDQLKELKKIKDEMPDPCSMC